MGRALWYIGSAGTRSERREVVFTRYERENCDRCSATRGAELRSANDKPIEVTLVTKDNVSRFTEK
jgi:hypothetical protein